MASITMTGRQLEKNVLYLCDIINDPLAQVERPGEWLQAAEALKAILSNPVNAERVFGVKNGKAQTRTLHVIGQRREVWLRAFYENEVKGNGSN